MQGERSPQPAEIVHTLGAPLMSAPSSLKSPSKVSGWMSNQTWYRGSRPGTRTGATSLSTVSSGTWAFQRKPSLGLVLDCNGLSSRFLDGSFISTDLSVKHTRCMPANGLKYVHMMK